MAGSYYQGVSGNLIERLDRAAVSGEPPYETTIWTAVVDGKRLRIETEARRTPNGWGYNCRLSYLNPADDPDPDDYSAHYALVEASSMTPRRVAEFIADKLELIPVLLRPELNQLSTPPTPPATPPVDASHEI